MEKINHEINNRQRQILKAILLEKHNKEIAEQLYVSEKTVERDIRLMCDVLNVKGKVGLAIFALKEQI